MSSVLKHWREAATLLLVAKTRKPSVTSFQSTNYDVLMLKRSGKSKFMPKLHVFPGGLAHDSDFSPQWFELYSKAGNNVVTDMKKFLLRGGPGAYMFSRERPEEFSKIPSELAFRICAIRETFEESGILLVRDVNSLKCQDVEEDMHPLSGKSSVLSDTILQPWRQRVDSNADEFITMCKELNVVPDIWSLYEWSNWLTPLIPRLHESHSDLSTQGRRYDTAFYICVLDYIPHAVHDDKETTELEWSPASLLLQKHMDGKSSLSLAPPQVVELARLLNFTDVEELKQFSWKQSATRCQRYFPVPCIADDSVLYLYPGDDLYPENPDFVGEGPQLKVEGGREELRVKYPNMNRSEIYMNEKGEQVRTMMCNVKMADGHVSPHVDMSHMTLGAKL